MSTARCRLVGPIAGWLAALLLLPSVSAEAPAESVRSLIQIIPETRGGEVTLQAQLRDCVCACLTVYLDLENARTSASAPFQVDLVQPRTKLTVLRAADRTKRWRYGYRTRYVIGRRGAWPEYQHLYRVPFSRVTRYRLTQGFGGTFSHQPGTPSEFSVDWEMPVGTEVLAARAGRVVAVRDDQNVGGPKEWYRDRANFVIVEHADGTLAEYMHLRHGGAAARPGQPVEAGDLLGYSGNTGFSSLPHLHVRVYYLDAAGEPRGLPVRWDLRERYEPPRQPRELPFRLPVLHFLRLPSR